MNLWPHHFQVGSSANIASSYPFLISGFGGALPNQVTMYFYTVEGLSRTFEFVVSTGPRQHRNLFARASVCLCWTVLFITKVTLRNVPDMQVTCLPVPGLVRSMELTVILQCLALVTADAIAQCLALLCISQCASAAAKSAHMDSGAWLFNLPIPAFLMMATLCHCVLLEVNSFWCSTYNRTWPLCVGGGHWPDAKTFSDEWTALLRRCSLRKPFLICSQQSVSHDLWFCGAVLRCRVCCFELHCVFECLKALVG